jgi:hypothetical protein
MTTSARRGWTGAEAAAEAAAVGCRGGCRVTNPYGGGAGVVAKRPEAVFIRVHRFDGVIVRPCREGPLSLWQGL